MKKRIAAMLLAAVMVFNIVGSAKPAKAAVATAVEGGAVIGLSYAIGYLYAVMTGNTADASELAEITAALLENATLGGKVFSTAVDAFDYCSNLAVDAFVGTETTPSWYSTGWNQITKAVASWFDSGDVSLSDDGLSLSYSDYVALCNIMYDYVDFSLDLSSNIYHKILNVEFDKALSVQALPIISPTSSNFYIPVYYSSDVVYFCYDFLVISYESIYDSNGTGLPTSVTVCQYKNSCRVNSCLYNVESYFQYSTLSNSVIFSKMMFSGYDYHLYNFYDPVTSWYKFDSSGVKGFVSSDEVDTSLNQGYLITVGDIFDFYDSITGITLSPDTSEIDDLSDTLDDLLVLNPDPGLVVDTDPSIAVPTDAILVTDITGVDDMTLTDVMADSKPRLDLETPELIIYKFPFSLPFDLYRLLTIFVAEPIAPVFTIPISNVNTDLSAWQDNQTVAPYIDEDAELMFEIDEEIVIDLSNIPFLQPICYTCFIVSWIAFLIFITTKLIQH